MIEAAEAQDKRVGVQASRYEGYMVWINALVASAGGQIIEQRRGAARTPRRRSTRPPGDAAAEHRRRPGPLPGRPAGDVDRRRGGGPVGVPERRRRLHGQLALRLQAPRRAAVDGGAIDQSVVDDIGWARYPAVERRTAEQAAARAASTSAIGAFTKYPDAGAGRGQVHHLAARATSSTWSSPGNPAARGCGLRRPGGARGVPDGRPDPRVDQRGRAPAGDARTTATCRPRCSAPGTPPSTCEAPDDAGGDRHLHDRRPARATGCL